MGLGAGWGNYIGYRARANQILWVEACSGLEVVGRGCVGGPSTRGGGGVLGRTVRWELGVRLVALCGAWRQLFGKFGIDKQNVCL
jgi:hypothetical protein